MSKWDLQPFVEYKKSSLTQHALQQLKNAVCTGSHSFLTSLKERSGLADKNQPEHGERDTNHGNLSQRELPDENIESLDRKRRATSEKLILSENDCETHRESVKKNKHDITCSEQDVGGTLIPSIVDPQLADMPAESLNHGEGRRYCLGTETRGGDSEMDGTPNGDGCTFLKWLGSSNEVLTCEKHVPSCETELNGKSEAGGVQRHDIDKSKGNEDAEEVNISSDNDGKNDDPADISKKNAKEQDAMETTRLIDQNMSVDTSMKDSGDERCSLGKEADIEVVEQSKHSEGVNEVCTSSKSHVGPHEVLPHENQAPHLTPQRQNDKFDGEKRQDQENENAGDKSGLLGLGTTCEDMNQMQPSVFGDVPNVDEVEEVDTSMDSDGYHDETTNIATQKKTFLSSHCTYSHDSLATSDWRGLSLCVKCNIGGKLLVCGSDSCPLVIHHSCLGSDAACDITGEFYCPFCAYSRAISKYMEIKKRTALARKDLATFFCLGTQKGLQRQSQRSYGTNQSHLGQDDGLPKGNKVKNRAKKVSSRHRRRKLEYEQPGPEEHSPPFGRKVIDPTDSPSMKARQGSPPRETRGQHHRVALGIHKSQGENTASQVVERRGRSVKQANVRSKRENFQSPEADLPLKNKGLRSSQSTDVEETLGQENENFGASKYFIRIQKQERKPCSSYPAFPQLRRKRLPWTSEEEGILKEGMRAHCSPHDKLIPWKKILEHGAGVFHQSRSTIDLKDKWRNMCKATPK